MAVPKRPHYFLQRDGSCGNPRRVEADTFGGEGGIRTRDEKGLSYETWG